MGGWRKDVARLRESIAGTFSEGWRNDLIAAAKKNGLNPSDWRDAWRGLAEHHGAAPSSWRRDISSIALALGKPFGEGWRADLKYIVDYYTGNPPEPEDVVPVVLHTSPYTGASEVTIIVEGVEYDLPNVSTDGESAPDGTFIIRRID